MTLLVDAGALYAQADERDPDHATVTELLLSWTSGLVISPFGAAEADYLIERGLGVDAELAFLDDVVSGTFLMEDLRPVDMKAARDLVERYRDLHLGLSDASIVVLARRLGTNRILTLDERDFRAVTPLQGGHFTVLPADG